MTYITDHEFKEPPMTDGRIPDSCNYQGCGKRRDVHKPLTEEDKHDKLIKDWLDGK